jgi:glycosyltransferase involved in cell wall biosynthesis
MCHLSAMSVSPVSVLHVADSLGIGGTEKVMQTLVAHLDPARFIPAVYSPRDGERAAQIRALGIDTFVGGDLLNVLDRLKPHIVHLHRAGWPQPELLRPLQLAGVKAVVETNVFGRHDSSPAAGIIDRTLFVSGFCLNRFAEETGIQAAPPRYRYMYNPVETDFFESFGKDRDYSIPVAGRISRPDPGKWSRLALEFLPDTIKALPDFRYRIIGAIPEARDYVRQHGLDRYVIFHDPVTTDGEIGEFLDHVSLLAHANDTGESFGLAIAEAMACGLPVVTHPSSGLRDNAQLELVDHGVTGLVAHTAEEYAGAVIHLLTHPEEARRMGQVGRDKAARLYRAQTIARQLETIYEDLLASKGIVP